MERDVSGSCLENEVLRIRFDVDAHEKEIESLAKGVAKVQCQMGDISATLTQIKYAAYGALGFFIVNNLGLIGALKLVLS